MMSIIYLAIVKSNEVPQNAEESKDYLMYPLFRVMKCVSELKARKFYMDRLKFLKNV